HDGTEHATGRRAAPIHGRPSVDSIAADVTRMTTVAAFEIDHTQFRDPQGEAVKALPPFAADTAALVAMCRAMVLTRAFDAKAIALQRTGKIGTFASALGQEAVGVGVASAMEGDE